MPTYDLDRAPKTLLTRGNPKTAKGEKYGVLTAIMHLAPADLAGTINTCIYASDECKAACLNTAGRGGIGLDALGLNTIQVARIRKARFFKRDRAGFMAMLVRDVALHEANAKRHGLKPAVRGNGTSDLPFERFPVVRDGKTYACIMDAFPDVTFYDYTKWPRALRGRKGILPANYSLTFSLSENPDSEKYARDYLAAGNGVAIVFDVARSADLPATYLDATVIDGDATDLRFLDAPSVIVGLRAKGKAKGKGSARGFVRAV